MAYYRVARDEEGRAISLTLLDPTTVKKSLDKTGRARYVVHMEATRKDEDMSTTRAILESLERDGHLRVVSYDERREAHDLEDYELEGLLSCMSIAGQMDAQDRNGQTWTWQQVRRELRARRPFARAW